MRTPPTVIWRPNKGMQEQFDKKVLRRSCAS